VDRRSIVESEPGAVNDTSLIGGAPVSADRVRRFGTSTDERFGPGILNCGAEIILITLLKRGR
jgi:hypothetical protein